MRLILLAILFFYPWCNAVGQGFWFRPDKYFYQPNETAKFELLDGMDFIGSPISFRKDGLVSLEVQFKNLETDIRRNFVGGEKASFTAQLTGEGIYQIRLEALPTERWLSRNDFAEFVKQYGLEDAAGEIDALSDSVRLKVSRTLKGYVRCGKQFDRRPEGDPTLSIEIIPDKNPLLLTRGEKITFTVRKSGKPAFGLRVKIWNRWDNRTTIQHIYTQEDGSIDTTISSPGDWMVSVVQLKKSEEANVFEVESYSLLFGYR